MSALEQVPDKEEEDLEEAVPENKWTLDRRAEGFQLPKTAFDFLYDVDPSVIQALKQNKCWYHIAVFLEKYKSKKDRQKFLCIAVKLCRVCPLPPTSPFPPLLLLRQQDQPVFFLLLLSLLRVKITRVKTFIIHSHLMNSK